MTNLRKINEWFMLNNSQISFGTRKGNIKLQKLLYYAKAMYFAVYNKPLFEEKFEAWENGPVIKEAYCDYRYGDLTKVSRYVDESREITEEVEKVLKVVNYVYGYQTTDSLIDLTHSEKPWRELESLVKERANPIIEDEVIKDYYKDLKDIYFAIDEEEIENTNFVNVNGNVFSYDQRELTINDSILQKLMKLGEQSKDEIYAIYLDENEELVIY